MTAHFVPVLVKGLYQTESYSLHVMQLIRILSTEEYFYFPHLVMWGRYCACEILIANPIDWLYTACLEHFIFFLNESVKGKKIKYLARRNFGELKLSSSFSIHF
jgi:hypothetical protein